MRWDQFLDGLSHTDRARLARSLVDARQYGSLPARAPEGTDVEWIVSCIDRAMDALAAARILIGAQPEPQPWADAGYRAFRTHRPESSLRMDPAELTAVREAVRGRDVPAPAG
jgi:hypothetical protein